MMTTDWLPCEALLERAVPEIRSFILDGFEVYKVWINPDGFYIFLYFKEDYKRWLEIEGFKNTGVVRIKSWRGATKVL